ncbi:hypothetical protein BHM03_00011279 [Ensete ventricosum]|nr:hypothetical protein BHM03_00011279 [Ensete ventricosum]
MWTARYRSAVDFNRRRSIEGEKGKKKKKRKRRKKKKGEEEPTFHMPSSLAGRPRTITALTLSPPSPAGAFSPVRGDRTSPYAGRKIEVTLNFGFKMVRASKDLTIKAEDIVAAGLQPALAVETALITLAHLALASEEVEIEVLAVSTLAYLFKVNLQAVFMICVVAAMDPSHR